MEYENKTETKLINKIKDLSQKVNELEKIKAENKEVKRELVQSQQFYKNILDSINDPVFIKDEQYRVVYINDAHCKIMKRDREDLIGKSDFDLFSKKEAEVYREKDNKVFKTGKADINAEPLTIDGKRHIISTKKSLYKDSHTGKKYIVGTIRNITEHNRAEKELRESEQQLSRIYDSVGVVLFYLAVEPDDCFRILSINQLFMDSIGLAKDQIVGKRIEEVIPEPLVSMVRDNYKKAIKEKRVVSWEQISEYSTDVKVGEVSIMPFFNDVGICTHLVGSVYDATERKKAEGELKKRTHDLGKRVKELNCLYGISKIVDHPESSIDEILKSIVDLLPQSWQYPDIICAIINFENNAYKTSNFKITKWKQSSEMYINENVIGSIEVYYLEEKPDLYEGPFLKEERDLIDAVAKRVGKIIKRKQTEEALRESEERYRLIIENQTDVIYKFDLERNIQFASPSYCRMFGKTEEELLGTSAWHLFHEEDREITLKAMEDLYKPPFRCYVEQRVMTNDGWRLCGWTVNAVLDDNNNPTSFVSTGRDITERKRIEEKIERLARFPSENPNPVIRVAKNGILLYANESSKPLLDNWGSKVSQSLPVYWKKLIEESLATGQNKIEEEEAGDKIFSFVIAPLAKAEYVNMYGRDITKQRKTEENLRKSNTAIETALTGIITADMEGYITYVNPTACSMWGYRSASEMIGTHILSYHPKRVHKKAGKMIETLKQKGVYNEKKGFWCKRKDDSEFIADINASLIKNNSGNVVGMVCSFIDITERKRAEEEIEKLAKFPGENPNPVLRISKDGNIIYSNKSSHDLLTVWRYKEGHSLSNQWLQSVKEALDSEKYKQKEVECGDKILSLTFAPVVDFNYVNVYGLDITDLTKAKVSIQKAHDELEKRVEERTAELIAAQEQIIRSERLAATGQLAASVAHEINSPLQAITMLLGTMRRENEENKELLDNIDLLKGAFFNIKDTVKNLMDLNRPGKERKQMINVNTIIENTNALMKSHLKKNKVKIDLNLSATIPDMIASPQQLGHVFLNLINNAVEAMSGISKSEGKWKERAKIGGGILIKTTLKKDKVVIQVSDTGPGIAEDDLKHIFDPFYTRKKTMGTGVGLSVCNGIVEDHNGTIEARNAKDGGAVFTVTLPLKTIVMKVS